TTAGPRPRVVASDPRRLGRAGTGGVTFTEFLDFECEACAAVFPAVEQLRDEYAGRVTFNIRYFPLPSHANARNAAHAVEAAAQQGKLEAMYRRMYETQPSWGEQSTSKADVFRGFAQELGLDMEAYDRAVRDPATAARVERDFAAGRALGVQGTPTFFINEQRVEPQSLEELRSMLDAALRDS
ncbi:MAG TPA: thioredoxin domain-containing protein, partial [Miltoncostaeaceae bacterium]|nr:thioredoxin domain-containing protein [Miltoncostaeaceae bacterium]